VTAKFLNDTILSVTAELPVVPELGVSDGQTDRQTAATLVLSPYEGQIIIIK